MGGGATPSPIILIEEKAKPAMTSTVPLSGTEVHSFTPSSLENIFPKPTFRFRAATERDNQRYGHILASEGIRHFPQEVVRAEMLATLKENWSDDVFETESSKLQDIFARIDQKIDIKPEEQEAVSELMMRCMDVSPMLRRMDADNRRFGAEAPAVALGLFLVGWSNVDAPFKREAGVVPNATLSKLANVLAAIEQQALDDKVEGVVAPGMAFIQLTTHAFQLMLLDEDAVKNSSAPSPSSGTRSGSKTTSQRDGASKGKGARSNSRRTKTPETSSQPISASS